MLNKGLASHAVPRAAAAEAAQTSGRLANDPAVWAAASLAAGPASVLDAKALAQLRELDPTGANRFVERVLATFQKSAGRLATNLVEARRRGDQKTIRLVVHTLKSSSASIGALELARRCGAIEAAIVSGCDADLDADLDAMVSELDLTLGAIAERLGAAP